MAILMEQNFPEVRQAGIVTDKPIVANQLLYGVQVLGTGSSVSLDPTKGSVVQLTPTQSMTINAVSVPVGQELYLAITTSGASSFTITFGINFKTTGTLATGTTSGKVFIIEFISDGVNFNEVSRTTAM